MRTFWKWPVRNLALATGVASIAAGFAGISGWALALASACLMALLAKAADSAYQAAVRRAERKVVVRELAAARSRHRRVAAGVSRKGAWRTR